MTKLKNIKEFNMLQRNLELTKALQDVDRLKAENTALNSKINSAIHNIENRIMHTKDTIKTIEDLVDSQDSEFINSKRKNSISELKIDMEAYSSFLKLFK